MTILRSEIYKVILGITGINLVFKNPPCTSEKINRKLWDPREITTTNNQVLFH